MIDVEGRPSIERIMTPDVSEADRTWEKDKTTLRPETFADYPGQHRVKQNLETYVRASKLLGRPLDHVLLHGPPGLGKTTLARIIGNELGVSVQATSGPCLERPGDLAGVLASLSRRAVLFIDEIHRMPIQVEEVLYSAMEDFAIDVIVGQGPTTRTLRMPVEPFTLIGATTKVSRLSRPFLSRFLIQERLDFYDQESLEEIIRRSAHRLEIQLSDDGAAILAARSRGTPRLANRLLRNVWYFAVAAEQPTITGAIVDKALQHQEIDDRGLDQIDRQILETISLRYHGGPVGIEALAATLGEERATIEEVYEPYLVYTGFVTRGPRGRVLTEAGKQHLDRFTPPQPALK